MTCITRSCDAFSGASIMQDDRDGHFTLGVEVCPDLWRFAEPAALQRRVMFYGNHHPQNRVPEGDTPMNISLLRREEYRLKPALLSINLDSLLNASRKSIECGRAYISSTAG